MKNLMSLRRSLSTVTAISLIQLGLAQMSLAHAEEPPAPPAPGSITAPPPPPGPGRERGPQPGPKHGPLDGPGPRDDQAPPAPPRPGEDRVPVAPVDPQAASVAVKTATEAANGFVPGQVWVRTAPRGEQQLQATILWQNREVARLEFDPSNGSVIMRGERPPVPPASPEAIPKPPASPSVAGGPAAPTPPAQITDNPNGGPSLPVPPPATAPNAGAPAPAGPAEVGQVKAKLPETLKALSVGQGAELLLGEGFWKVPLIYQNRVVAELHVSADGTRVIQDFAAARDAAIFAR